MGPFARSSRLSAQPSDRLLRELAIKSYATAESCSPAARSLRQRHARPSAVEHRPNDASGSVKRRKADPGPRTDGMPTAKGATVAYRPVRASRKGVERKMAPSGSRSLIRATLPFSCPFDATSPSKTQQSATQQESEIEPIFTDEMCDPASGRNEPQRAATVSYSASPETVRDGRAVSGSTICRPSFATRFLSTCTCCSRCRAA